MVSLLLFIKFVQFGILCFGGGYMIIPLLYSEYVKKNPLFSAEEYGNLLSISQITPGPVSINTATYVGYLQDNVIGALSASLGLCVPSFVLAVTALIFIEKYKTSVMIQGIMKGAKWAALVMILFATFFFANISIFKHPIPVNNIGQALWDPATYEMNVFECCVLVVATILSYRKVSVMKLLLASGVVGFIYSFI